MLSVESVISSVFGIMLLEESKNRAFTDVFEQDSFPGIPAWDTSGFWIRLQKGYVDPGQEEISQESTLELNVKKETLSLIKVQISEHRMNFALTYGTHVD